MNDITPVAALREQAATLRLHGLLEHWAEVMAQPDHAQQGAAEVEDDAVGPAATSRADESIWPARAQHSLAACGLGAEDLQELWQRHACCIPCDHVPVRSWPLFKARGLMRDVIESFRREQHA